MSVYVNPWIIDFPKECEVIQRNEDGCADIPVRVFDTERRSYRAEIEGVAVEDIDFSDKAGIPADNVGEGIFRCVPAGDYRLLIHGEDVTKVIDRIGVGDVHGALGQSHIAGRSWTLFRSADGRTVDPTNINDARPNLLSETRKFGGEYNPEGQALGSWMPGLADFLTEYWCAPQKFLNYAVGGSHTSIWQPGASAFKRAVNAFLNAGVRYVMYNIGATDAMQGASVEQMKERMAVTVRALQEPGFIVLLGCMPFGLRNDDGWNAAMTRQQQAAHALWEEIPGLYRGADMSKLDPRIHINRVDMVHLNAEGYLEAARLWAQAYCSLPMPAKPVSYGKDGKDGKDGKE